MKFRLLAAALAAAGAFAAPAQAQVEIQWWHSMTGALGDRVSGLAKDFSASQSQCKVNAVFKGSYDDSMTAAVAAFRAGQAPHILQAYEVGTATMMYSKAIKPVAEIMRESGAKWDPKAYVPAVASYYTSPKGDLVSFPFNSSTTVFFWNKDAFKAAEFLMDYLKTRAPFWKKEQTGAGARWVDARTSDDVAAGRWRLKG